MSNKMYEEESIRAIAEAIRAKGIQGSMTVAQMAGKVAEISGGGGGEPALKKWTVTVASEAASSKTLYLLNDSWLAEHWNDPRLEAFLVPANETDDTAKTYFAFAYGRNGHMSGTTSIYGFSVRIKGTGTSITNSTYQLGVSSNTLTGCISVASTGDLKLRVSSACVLPAGDYTVYAHLR